MTEKANGKKPEVKYLYHGTREALPNNVYTSEEGFDMRFSQAGMWGRAVYFAANSIYSHSYRHTVVDA